MKKSKIYLLGLITLFLFPVPSFLFLHWQKQLSIADFLELETFSFYIVSFGIAIGLLYALFAMMVMKTSIFQRIPLKIDELVRSLHLNLLDALFLSLCAGLGEELLFRTGVQSIFGIWPTAIFFVAIHGYFSLKEPLNNLYGLLVLPFILLLGYGFESYGLWFVASAHFSYDLLLFVALILSKSPVKNETEHLISRDNPYDQATSSENFTSDEL